MAYAETRAANPGALGLTIGLNAAAVLALALWNPNIIKQITKPWTIIDIGTIDPVPPPPPLPEPAPKPKTQIERVDPVVGGATTETRTSGDPFVDRGPIIDFPGTGPGPTIDPPPQQPVHNIVRTSPTLTTSTGNLQPPYPPALQRQEMEGSVTVRILVGSDGRPKDIVLVRADHPDFFAAAKSWGMRHWRFKPAAEDEKAVDGWYTLTVKFNIE